MLPWMAMMNGGMGDIADFGNNIVVSCNKEAMNSEVSSMKQRSLDIINSIETH
jgi:hypothetical protein